MEKTEIEKLIEEKKEVFNNFVTVENIKFNKKLFSKALKKLMGIENPDDLGNNKIFNSFAKKSDVSASAIRYYYQCLYDNAPTRRTVFKMACGSDIENFNHYVFFLFAGYFKKEHASMNIDKIIEEMNEKDEDFRSFNSGYLDLREILNSESKEEVPVKQEISFFKKLNQINNAKSINNLSNLEQDKTFEYSEIIDWPKIENKKNPLHLLSPLKEKIISNNNTEYMPDPNNGINAKEIIKEIEHKISIYDSLTEEDKALIAINHTLPKFIVTLNQLIMSDKEENKTIDNSSANLLVKLFNYSNEHNLPPILCIDSVDLYEYMKNKLHQNIKISLRIILFDPYFNKIINSEAIN